MVVVDDAGLTLYQGDCRTILPTLAADSVHCVVTSPPYWGLRDYGVDGQLGLEATPEEYVAGMVAVFRAVRRVLRADGTLWMNMGDAFTDKQLVGMPWRLAFALQADGWYLRADIIWAKPNPMPESVTDRPTKAHEYVFLLSKAARYFYDADAVREPATGTNAHDLMGPGYHAPGQSPNNGNRGRPPVTEGRNLRSVWTIPSAPFPDAHFATFPPALAARCIQAGSSARGCCQACGAPWVRQVDKRPLSPFIKGDGKEVPQPDCWKGDQSRPRQRANDGTFLPRTAVDSRDFTPRIGARDAIKRMGDGYAVTTTGWAPTCPCPASPPIPCTVLDPFAGSGTVGLVAEQLGRHATLIELSPAYVQMAEDRTAQRGLFTAPCP